MTHQTDEDLKNRNRKASAFMRGMHKTACYEQGDHPDECDSYFSLAADALDAITSLRAQLAEARAERDAVVAVRDMLGNRWATEKDRADRAEAALAAQIEVDAGIADDYTPEKHSGMTLQAHVTGRNIASAIRNQPCARAALEAAHTEIAPMDKIDTSTALLPCPFCGGEAILMTPAGSRPYIMCAEHFCGGPQNSTEVAIAAWNRRAIPAVRVEVTPEEAALEEQIEKLRNLCDCDCDDEDCVKCAHYPAILEQKKDELARIRSALGAAPRVNETPKSGPDSADVLATPPAPVTLAEALQVPEVRALVEALDCGINQYREMREVNSAFYDAACAALSATTEERK